MSGGTIVDLFAGPGGWSEGLRMLGRHDVGIEWDDAACRTRAAAGHLTVRADVAEYPPERFAGCEGLIASPPCPDWSPAGKRQGLTGSSGHLIFEVLRWVEAVRPRWVACEQAKEALPYWLMFARRFEELGYSVRVAVLNAADYGVPQERYRAFLLARRGAGVQPPRPTHAEHPHASLLGVHERPWVSMADGLGWGATDRPAPTVTAGGTKTGGAEPIARGGRDALRRSRDAGEWVVNTRQKSLKGGKRTEDYKRSATRPAPKGSQGRNAKTTEQVRAGEYDGTEPIKLTLDEGITLQTFRPDYPFQGGKGKKWEQIGNAVPPLLAAHVLSSLLGVELELAA